MNDPQIITPGTATAQRALPGPGTQTQEFGALARRVNVETAAEVLAAQAKAAVQARYIMAIERPRDTDQVRQRMLHECERSSFADSAMYKKPVGGKNITGLSVRFAEAVARYYGNLLIDPAIVYDDATKRIIRVTATDLETNLTFSKDLLIEKTVERRKLKDGQQALGSRLNSYGDTVYLVEATEDDLLVKEAAQMAKARRQLILMLVPGDLQDECADAINCTINRKVENDPDAEKKRILDAFDDLGIRVEQIKKYLDVSDLSALTPKDLIALRGIYTAIREGETNWREVMEQRDAARGTDTKPAPSTKAAEILSKIAPQTPQGAPAPQGDTQASPTTPTPQQAASAPQDTAQESAAPQLKDLFSNSNSKGSKNSK